MGPRMASSMYEENLDRSDSSFSVKKAIQPSLNAVKLNNNIYTNATNNQRTKEEWLEISETAAFFKGTDPVLDEILIMVYEDPDSKRMSTVVFSILGDVCYNSLTIDHKSRFYTACKNLAPEYRDSNVRRALAVSLLRAYSSISPTTIKTTLKSDSKFGWDETVAGEVASKMKLITSKTPRVLGKELLSWGFLQSHYINSTLLDVLYDDEPEVIDDNNKIVYLLGKQLEHLFDPLTEYSPESATLLYVPPSQNISNDDQLVKTICSELIQLQENITTQLVKFLREVVVPTRMKSLTNEIPGLFASTVNQAFPPTIDEITRVNCIFLEALTAAYPFGSFEVVKACGSTIPYFYKANMRHESAIRSFSESLKSFLKNYGDILPENYTERQIESIMKAPINLTKIKLILERLINTKNWSKSETTQVQHFFKLASDTIDSFGKDDLKPYNRRVFTPSGKILTEICEDWPSVLSYGWMNRKVISVFDTQDNLTNQPGVIILFSDYIVFANVESDEEKTEQKTFEPQISNILMNSLINENPIKNIPTLKVTSWTTLANIDVTTFDKDSIRIIIKDEKGSVLSLKIEDNLKFLNVLNKAKILSKTSPFHLFKNENLGFTIYSTAHQRDSYIKETTRSSIALFLNIELSIDLLKKYNLYAGIGARLEDDMIVIKGLTVGGERFAHTINPSELSAYLSEEVSSLETKRRSIQYPDLFRILASANKSLISKVITQPKSSTSTSTKLPKTNTKVSNSTGSTPLIGQRAVSNSSVINNQLPKLSPKIPQLPQERTQVVRKAPASSKRVEEKKSKTSLMKRISQIFTKKDKSSSISLTSKKSRSSLIPSKLRSRSSTLKSSANIQPTPKVRNSRISVISKDSISAPSPILPPKQQQKQSITVNSTRPLENNAIPKVQQLSSQARQVSEDSTPDPIFDDSIPELSSFDDCKTFETSMSPIFSDDFDSEGNIIPLAFNNWTLARDNSSRRCGLNNYAKVDQIQPAIERNMQARDSKKPHASPLQPILPLVFETNPEIELNTIPKVSSIDDSFNSPLLKIAISEDNLKDKDDDIYYTPKSVKTPNFPEFEEQEKGNYELLEDDLDQLDFGSFDVDIDESPNNDSPNDDSPVKHGTTEFIRYHSPTKERTWKPLELTTPMQTTKNSDEVQSFRTSSFKSCLSEHPEDDLDNTTEQLSPEKGVLQDDSFRYLANIFNGTFNIDTYSVRNSDSYKTLPRSFSSIKYLANYIDNDALITDLSIVEE